MTHAPALIQGARTVLPSEMKPGDIVADIANTTRFLIEEITPIEITYQKRRVPVWHLKGYSDAGFGHTPITFLCVPRQPWYLIQRAVPV